MGFIKDTILLLRQLPSRKKKIQEQRQMLAEQSRPADAYVQSKIVHRNDGRPIQNAEVPYLVATGLEIAKESQQSLANPKFSRTARETELAFQFYQNHGHISQKKTDCFEDLERQAFNTSNIDEKIELLQAALVKYHEAKMWHYNKSKGAMLWFQDMWENQHNSKNPCFGWDESVRENLNALIMERDVIRPCVMSFAARGGLQRDLCKQFPPEQRRNVQACVKRLEKAEEISREKKGNTYYIRLI